MRSTIAQMVGLLWLTAPTLPAKDLGGLSASFKPATAKPGDLITLWVEMNREDYAEFDLKIPSHPQLHLVAREKVPIALVNGKYYQGERLMLQPLSSGNITLSEISVELTETTGPRKVSLPKVSLPVEPFELADNVSVPEPLPQAASDQVMSPSVFIPLLFVVAGALLLIFLIRLKLSISVEPEHCHNLGASDFSSILRASTITHKDLETILNKKGAVISDKLRENLEEKLYSLAGAEPLHAELHQQLRKELDP